MFWGKANKWKASVKKLQNNEITLQDLINANENKTLYYSTPFVENARGQSPNVLQTNESEVMFFPAFSTAADLRAHMAAIGCSQHLIIKGNLKGVLASLDSHPILQTWGVVIDPHTADSVGIPPRVRVRPKCLR